MNRLLTGLGSPHKQLRTIHVAGTKGKGSTATMLARMLQSCDYTVGLYTSPHLVEVRERITVNGQMIKELELTRLIARIAKAAKRMKGSSPTYFEVLTAAAFCYFVDQEVDLAVIETGVGGRLDSTNVIKPEVCALTSISLDHTSVLGNTLAEIAEEKAGVFKSGVPVVSAPQRPEVKKILRRAAEHSNAPLSFTGEDIEFSYRFESARPVGPHTRICVTTPSARFEHLHVPLLGDHQAVNCSVALGCMAALKERGIEIDEQKAIAGLSKVTLPGRMEMVNESPRVLVDGAHNAASVHALMRAIGQNIPYDSMVVIFACQADKDIRGMLKHIQLGADKTIFTYSGAARTADPYELLNTYSEMCGKMAQVADTLEEALEIAERAVGRDDLICICGSFYLVGKAKRLFAKSNGDSS
ncbi:MAG: bifunctional folylpolyglutamate synthase/dihydrofolate synthase [Phycisphaerales bacterium]|nr:MAG: bifunctional folylpolyglutamate synthase/dihydrofolate synthase [Phycisphaerales bacterium]